MSKCLVFGGNGFIGSHLVDRLVFDGHDVVVFDRFKDGRLLFNENDKIKKYNGDFQNRSDIKDVLQSVDYVFHFISTTSPATAENDPLIDVNTNLAGSIALFQECVNANIKKVIFASSGGAIYGSSPTSCDESYPPHPISPYAINKLAIENYLNYFSVKHGLDSLVLRISNPYGERQPFNRKQGVIPIFLENIYNNKPVVIYGDGSMQRDYIYVQDVANAIVNMFQKKTIYNVYNIGSGIDTSINELLNIIKDVVQENFQVTKQPAPSTYIQKISLDIQRYTSEFGKINSIDLKEGVKRTYSYIVNNYSKFS